MKSDPIPFLVSYLKTVPSVPKDSPTGSLVGREVGEVTIYAFHSGGFRVVRDSMDRADIIYDVYHKDRASAASLAYLTREALLENLPGKAVDGVQVLDVQEISSPRYMPDAVSLEDAYSGEVSIFYTEI
ncbi:hypothetical protein ACFQ71_03040 [Streptomyces sp. NPDC056534]|uniref:hypothetical protein n=1 Tax=Streptomyces sp. NPDC056534 TaxID=3345857 RepID=UPI0036C9C378